ncbi:hypothetical protein GCM10011339_13040 [Echinicola rosea]|uniref:PEGA domain-containing protein n=2 Tax=Echinicola rosea TaxID=1807691 RepID=A0ABQ1USV7_9BACT|nr:hypothetical protein GCM10011339_13040 [Echinicola rosea]
MLFIALILFPSCASSTLIQSTPGEAKLYLNDEYVGVTPYKHRDSRIVGSSTDVRLEKEGYETFTTFFSRDEKADVGAIIGGFFLLFPFLWTMKYKPSRTYELTPLNSYNEVQEDDSSMASKADELLKLQELVEKGLITQEEFVQEKKKILDEK